MAGEPLVEELTLDIQPALTALEPIGSAFEGIISSFSSGLADGISSALGNIAGIDTSGITTAVEGALTDAASTPVVVEGDVTALDTALSDALSAPAVVPVDGDTSGLTTSIDAATASAPDVPLSGDATDLVSAISDATSAPQSVPVDADTTAAQSAIDGLTGTPIDIVVDADTSQAQASIDGLGNSATGSTDSIDALTQSTDVLSATAGVAKGEVNDLGGFISNIGPKSAAAVGGVAAFVGIIGEATSLAATAQVTNKAFADTFGNVADSVRQIDVGGLVISLDDLGKQSGTTNTALEASATRVGLLGNAAGAAKPQIAGTASDLLGIAGALSVANPALGDTANVADTLTKAFSTGRTRGLLPYGISLSQNAILQEALRENVGKTASELTAYDKIVAGVILTQNQFGNSLGTKFAEGSQNAQIQLRALKVQLEETLVAVGGPLLEPLVTSLKAVLPVAQELGLDLGALARIVLPLVADLAPALAPVAGVLHLVGDGLDFIASAVDKIPAPVLLGIAAGAVAIGAGFGIASLGVVGFGAAVADALGPIGIAVAVVGALGAAVDLFGSHATATADVAKIFGDSLFGAGSGADTLSGQLGLLDKNVTKIAADLITSLGSDKISTAIRTALDTAGGGAEGLAKALTGTSDEFDAYTKSVAAATAIATPWGDTVDLSTGLLKQQRDALRQSEQEQLQNLVSTNQLTQADLDAIEARHKLADGTTDLAASLKDAAAITDEVARKQALATKVQTGAVREAVDAFLAGGQSADAFSANLQALGFSSQDAAKFSGDLATAQRKSTDEMALASPAAEHLAAQFAAGNISASQFEGGLVSLGVSVPGTADRLQALTSAVDSFVNSAAKLAPSIDTALASAEKNQTQAAADAAKAADTQGKTIESVRDKIDQAYQKIALAHDKGGKAGATAVHNAEIALVLAVSDGNKQLDGAAQSVAETNLKLVAAADPQRLIDALRKGLTDITNFEANLAKIVDAGGLKLAESLAARGPEIEGAQAAALAQDPKAIKITEALVSKATNATGGYIDFLRRRFGPDVAQAYADQSAVAASGFDPNLVPAATAGMEGARTAIVTLSPGVTAASLQAGADATAGFASTINLGGVTGEAMAGVPTSIVTLTPEGVAAAAKSGTDVTAGFGGALDPSGQLSQKFQDGVNTILSAEASLIPAASGIGFGIGRAFDEGIGSGINANTGVIAAAATAAAAVAETAANARLKRHSPSLVGVAIGADFVQGIAIGLSNTAPISAATGAITSSLSSIGAGIGDTSTIDEAIKKLDELIAKEHQQQAAAASFTAAQTALNQFVSSAVSALPSASNAVRSFSTDVISAMTAVTKAEADTAKARAKFEADTSKLQGAVILAQQKRDFDIAHGASQRQIFLDQAAVDKAQHDLTVASLLDTKALQDATSGLGAAQKTLSLSSDPAKFIASLNKQNAATADFTKDIKILAGRGLTDLAQLLASQGPEVAGALADALVAAPAKAKLAEKAIDAGKKVSGDFQKSLTDEFAVNGTTVATALGEGVGLSILKGSHAAITASGDLLFSALTDPFKGKSVTVPVTLTSPTIKLPPAGTVATNAANAISSFTTNALSSLTLDLNLTLEDGRVVQTQVTVPVKPNGQAKQRATAKVKAKARA